MNALLRAQTQGGYAAFWATADQGVVSLGTFITTIILARSLATPEYGLYAIIFGVILVLNNVHGSLVVYPLLIHGARLDETQLRTLASGSLFVTLCLGAPLVALLSAVLVFMGRWELVLPACAALIAWQLQEALRRCFTAQVRNLDAIFGDALRYMGQVAGIALLYYTKAVTVERAFLIITLTSTVAIVAQSIQLRLPVLRLNDVSGLPLQFCRDGKWVLLTHLFGILSQQALPWILGASRGLQDAAAFQSLANLAGMSHPIMFSTGNLITPVASKAFATNGFAVAFREAARYVGHGSVLLGPYFAALLLFPDSILNLMYGRSSPYAMLAGPLRILTIAYCLYYAAHVTGSFLNGINRSRAVSMIQLAGLVPIAIAAPVVQSEGVSGAMAMLACSAAVRLFAGVMVARSAGSKPLQSPAVQLAQ